MARFATLDDAPFVRDVLATFFSTHPELGQSPWELEGVKQFLANPDTICAIDRSEVAFFFASPPALFLIFVGTTAKGPTALRRLAGAAKLALTEAKARGCRVILHMFEVPQLPEASIAYARNIWGGTVTTTPIPNGYRIEARWSLDDALSRRGF